MLNQIDVLYISKISLKWINQQPLVISTAKLGALGFISLLPASSTFNRVKIVISNAKNVFSKNKTNVHNVETRKP